jgi:hypothetical protein
VDAGTRRDARDSRVLEKYSEATLKVDLFQLIKWFGGSV